MLDDIYILHDYVKTVNDKISDIDISRVIRRIVTSLYESNMSNSIDFNN